MTDERPTDDAQGPAPLTRDHLAPGTDPEDVGAPADPGPRGRLDAVEQPPAHGEDTHGAAPTAERPHLEGSHQNPR